MDRNSNGKGAGLMAKIGLFVVTLIFALGFCELVVRAFVTVRNVGPPFTTYSPAYGKRVRPSISVKRVTPEFTMRFTTNAQGFRQPDIVAPGSHPVLFLGDSFTMGYGVDDGEDFVSLIRIQRSGEAGPFLNAGIGDNGNGRWLKFLTHEAPQYAPSLVVLQLADNDFYDNQAEWLYTLQDGELVEQPIPKPGARRMLQGIISSVPLISNSYLVGSMRQLRLPRSQATPDGDAGDEAVDADELTYRLVERALALCDEQGWPALGLSVELQGTRLQRMKQIFAEHQAELLDAPRKENNPELYYEVDGHWNAAGHAHVAAMLQDALPE